MKVNDPSETYEPLEDSGPVRLRRLGAMLSGALQSTDKDGDVGRDVASKSSSLIKPGRLLTGRQVTHMLCHRPRLSESRPEMYTMNGRCSVRWLGDGYEEVSQLKDRWGRLWSASGESLLCQLREDCWLSR